MQQSYDKLIEKWSPVLDESSAGVITDNHKKAVTAAILENQEKAFLEESNMLNETPANTNATVTGTANWNPVLIALVRRAMPNLMAYDLAGVQPMTGPTGLIFAMKSNYKTTRAGVTAGDEALYNEAQTGYSGDSTGGTHTSRGSSGLVGATDTDVDSSIADSGSTYVPAVGGAMSTASAEALGNTGDAFAEMGFSIEKATVTAKSRALKAEYSLELAQDLKAIHGLDAETELANILSTEILAEINREIVRTINSQAKIGCLTSNVQTQGIFDLSTDADGRWSVE